MSKEKKKVRQYSTKFLKISFIPAIYDDRIPAYYAYFFNELYYLPTKFIIYANKLYYLCLSTNLLCQQTLTNESRNLVV